MLPIPHFQATSFYEIGYDDSVYDYDDLASGFEDMEDFLNNVDEFLSQDHEGGEKKDPWTTKYFLTSGDTCDSVPAEPSMGNPMEDACKGVYVKRLELENGCCLIVI